MIKNVVEKNKNIDVNEDKMNKLKEMFPNCFNINGEFDISVFEEELKANISIVKEGYGLNFLGKNYAKYVASLETETILVPDEENNNKVENENSENIYISGDNIDALKHLVKSYSGQIKCIYIDPPYNTGSDGFVYNDKFNLTIEKLIDVLDVNEDEAKRIYSMTNSKSNSHSAWLTFMYPRLYLARQLLTDDGIIFISIDDNEQSQLKLLCDSIFGEENIVSSICVNRTSEVATNNVIYKHEYMIAYSKNQELFKVTGVSKYTCSRGTVGNHDQTMPEIEFPSGLICKNVEDAKDVVQDTFIAYYTSDLQYNDEQHIRAWLFRITVNKAKDVKKSFWHRNKMPLEDYIESLPFETKEDSNLFEAVMHLPEKYRIVIHLFYYEDWNIREISEILHTSVSNVKVRLSRGRTLLKNVLKEEWADDE